MRSLRIRRDIALGDNIVFSRQQKKIPTFYNHRSAAKLGTSSRWHGLWKRNQKNILYDEEQKSPCGRTSWQSQLLRNGMSCLILVRCRTLHFQILFSGKQGIPALLGILELKAARACQGTQKLLIVLIAWWEKSEETNNVLSVSGGLAVRVKYRQNRHSHIWRCLKIVPSA